MQPLTKEQADEILEKMNDLHEGCVPFIEFIQKNTEKTAPPWYEGMTSIEIRKLARGLSQGVPDGKYINWSGTRQGVDYWQGVYNNLISLARELEECGK